MMIVRDTVYPSKHFESGNFHSRLSFQGRNASEVKKMIAHVRQFNATLTISVEMEKKKPELAQLLDLPDVLLMSKEYAGYHGYTSPEKACQEMRKKARDRYKDCILWSLLLAGTKFIDFTKSFNWRVLILAFS